MLIIDAAALDQAADALRTAGQYLTTPDGRRQLGPSLGPDAYRLHVITTLERILKQEIRSSDHPAPNPPPQDTWP